MALVVANKHPDGVPPLPSAYVSLRKNNKKLRKEMEQGGSKKDTHETNNNIALLAGSLVGRCRAQ